MTAVVTAVISLVGVLAVGVLAPVWLLSRTERSRQVEAAAAAALHREDRNAEWARQDAQEARLLAAQRAEAEQVHAAHQDTAERLNVIHTLVNSNLTAALRAEYEAVQRVLALSREVVQVRRDAGLEPTAEQLAAVETAQAKVHELAVTLADRAAAQEQVNADPGTPPGYRSPPARPDPGDIQT